MLCNATYWGVTSCLLTTTPTVVAVEAAEKVFQVVFQMASYVCGSTEILSRLQIVKVKEGRYLARLPPFFE
jgi:hypothetical protein